MRSLSCPSGHCGRVSAVSRPKLTFYLLPSDVQHRKSDVVVRFQNSAGAPLAGAAYKIEQVRSGFPWGVDIQPSVAQQPAYSSFLQSLFNQVQLWWSVVATLSRSHFALLPPVMLVRILSLSPWTASA